MALVINSFGQVREEKKIKINPSFMVATGGTLLFTYGVSNIIYPSQSSPFQNQKIPRWIEPTKGFLFFFGATLTIQGLWGSSKETNFND